MKYSKRINIAVILVVIFLFGAIKVNAAILIGGINYNISGTSASVTTTPVGGGTVVIPSTFVFGGTTYTVVSIEHYAFQYTGLTSVVIPDTVTSIGDYAFRNCNSLTSVVLSKSLLSIGQLAFEYCGISSITIPSTVQNIDFAAFYGCGNLSSVIFLGNTAPLVYDATTFGNIAFGAQGYYPQMATSYTSSPFSTKVAGELTMYPTATYVTSVSAPANATYLVGGNLDFTINLSAIVTVTGTPKITLFIGGITHYASYLSGSGTSSLVFRYTVQTGDSAPSGISVGLSINLNGGAITDSNSLNIDPTLYSVASTSSVNVNGILPTVPSFPSAWSTSAVYGGISKDVTHGFITFGNGFGDSAGNLSGYSHASATVTGLVIGASYTVTFTLSGGGTDIDNHFWMLVDGVTVGDIVNQIVSNATYSGTFVASATSQDITFYGYTSGNWILSNVNVVAGTTIVGAQLVPYPVPTISSISPSSGPWSGGTSLVITGTNLDGAVADNSLPFAEGWNQYYLQGNVVSSTTNSVNFLTTANPYYPNNATRSSSAVPISLIAHGLHVFAPSGSFTYTPLSVLTPTVTSVSPSSGPVAGGNVITVIGTGFYGGVGSPCVAAVEVGGVNATSINVISDTMLTCTTPIGVSGTASVNVLTQYWSSNNNLYSYLAAPVITSSLTASGNLGSALNYTITASNAPTSYSATGLPAGLSINSSSGLISGTPTTLGSSSVTINAINGGGTGSATLVINVGKGTPTITAAPTASSITYGQTLASSSLTGGTASVAGTFAFTNTGVAPSVGSSSQSVTFTPTNTANYNNTTFNISINVGKAPAGISIVNTTQTYTGKPISVTTSLSPSALSAAVVYYPGFNAPTEAGTYYVLVNVVDNTYYGSQSSVLTILPATQTVSVATPSNLRAGVPATLSATSTSNGPITYSVVSGNATISGSTLIAKDTNPIVIQATQAGTNDYQAASATATLTASAYSPVAITSNPTNQLVRSGSSATFTVNVSGTSPTYQWNLNGTPIAGATSASYTVIASSSNTGNYTCTITNAAGSVTTSAAALTLNTTHLANLSSRAVVGASNLTVGFVSTGSSSKSILLRGDGPSLANYGVTGVLANPILTLYNSSGSSLASNSTWGGASSLSSLFTQVGAFPLTAASNDAVLNQSLSSGTYSAIVSGANSSTGAAMVEIYDADPTGATSRLVNISARGMVGTGSSIMTGGFVITGNSTETVLIRAVGPTLSTYGVTGVLAQPTLTVYNSSGTSVASNTIWGGGSTLSSTMTQVGAFALPTTSADSAVLVTLPAGAYTVQVSGVNGTTGNALVEIYEVSSP